jgi:hypothetical protein
LIDQCDDFCKGMKGAGVVAYHKEPVDKIHLWALQRAELELSRKRK